MLRNKVPASSLTKLVLFPDSEDQWDMTDRWTNTAGAKSIWNHEWSMQSGSGATACPTRAPTCPCRTRVEQLLF